MSKIPTRPEHLAEDVQWNANQKEWVQGKYSDKQKPIGKWQSWTPEGVLKADFYYNSEGEYHGIYHFYHPDGSLAQKGRYLHNKIDGLIHSYRPEGQPNHVTNFADKKIVRAELVYEQGKYIRGRYYNAQGELILSNGQKRPKGLPAAAWEQHDNYNYGWAHCVNDPEEHRLHGAWIFYSAQHTPIKSAEIEYNNQGKIHGILRQFHPDGSIAKEARYENGNAVGVHSVFRNPTSEYSVFNYFNYSDNQNIHKKELVYENNTLIETRYFNAEGKRCTSKGYAILEGDLLSPLRDYSPNDYLSQGGFQHFNHVFGHELTEPRPEFLAEQAQTFEYVYGKKIPEDLNRYYAWTQQGNLRGFRHIELSPAPWTQLLAWEAQGLNPVEQAILEDQKFYPGQWLESWFFGTLPLSKPQMQDEDSYYTKILHYSILTPQSEGQIYGYPQNSPQYYIHHLSHLAPIVDNLSAACFYQNLLTAHFDYEKINRATLNTLWRKLDGLADLPYYFHGYLYSEGNSFSTSNASLSKEFQLKIDTYSNANNWLIEYLRGQADLNSFSYYVERNASFEASAFEHNDLPAALHLLWAAYLFQKTELANYLELAKNHPAALIRWHAQLIESFVNGETNALGMRLDLKKDIEYLKSI